MANDVSKQQIRKPASPATANKPPQIRTKSLVNKTVASPKTAPKTRVTSFAATPSRSSSLPTPKPITGRSLKPVMKDEVKRRLSQPAINARRSSLGLAQAGEKMIHSLSNIVKDSTDVLVTEIDQEPLYFAKVGQEIDPADSYPDIKIQVFENKYDREESIRKQELVHDTKKKLAGIYHDVAEEKEVREVKVEMPTEDWKKETTFPPKQQERTHGKFDSPLSNNVIEEASNKLREQRINRVRALAGAFETVILLQEK